MKGINISFLASAICLATTVTTLRAYADDEPMKLAPGATATVPAGDGNTAGTGTASDYVIEKKGNTTIKYKKKTTYDFEGSNIDGAYNKPSGSYISNIKDVKARSIIRIRENFDAEVIDSARALK